MKKHLQEYKKLIEKIAQESGIPYLIETFQQTDNKIWQEYLDEGFDPSTALFTEAQGL